MINQTPSRQQATAWNIVRHTFNISHGGTDNFEWRHCCMTQIQDFSHRIDHDLDNQVARPFLTRYCADVAPYRSHPTQRCAIAGIYRSQPARHGLDRADLTYEGSICTEKSTSRNSDRTCWRRGIFRRMLREGDTNVCREALNLPQE